MKTKCLPQEVLKLIACITMFIDHFGDAIVPRLNFPFIYELYYILRIIGRISFPIYCFLIGEGLRHTRNQIKYLLRLLIFAIISEIPFNLMVRGSLLCAEYQNVFFTLFLGALAIYFYRNIKNNLLKAILMLAALGVSVIFKADYGTAGMAVIVVLYFLREHPIVQAIAGYPLFGGGIYAIAAFIPISMYNGQRGFIKHPVLKYAFYFFYPAHMLLLVAIRQLILKGVI